MGQSTIPKKKKCKKAKWLSEEALQIAVKRREVKSKGEKERYTHLNAELQRKARRDKKAFLSDQCKEIEENNRVGKTRDLFKKIRDTKGTFHAKMGSIKDRNGMYKNGSFNVSIIEYSDNQENYQKNYAKGNIALYFVPSTIKRAAGKITAKGKDIIMKYSERLLKYGYHIKGSRIEGIAHTVTDYDAESIAKSLRLINNAMHKEY